MSGKDVATWLTIGAMLIGAGIWLGKLQQQVSDMNAKSHAQQVYYHGSDVVPTLPAGSK